mmetsp:Transcript_60756/g.71102  ORF Transcript_60756/g.71102 Transcript_60756/m.71102 type:complete len:213 (+) Transcript_60756:92-730(+)|eukprot:CAMPEP_0171294612 /NCGR_PEP_ID=MMETSP0816-20121228/3116_1 /TAXON_ID=420281 /ORGANISM="Proboscia inermis, Strain CCAP1064/1" /LENGTH=212 /DNA_ID=CAMNT_0011766603 /DNA_START=308 /DNA_END=946 /DNA_ORIENTATION=+
MVKHNNIIPNLHFKKKYCASSRGPLKVKVNLNQAMRKKTRRLKRAAKAAAIAPRPLRMLRPIVHCPTQKYSAKARLGRGFTIEELKEAGLTANFARTVGIAVDPRRSNRSVESLNRNADRLREYKSKLVLFPKKGTGAEDTGTWADSSADDCANATQFSGIIMPTTKPVHTLEIATITDEMKNTSAFTTMRLARQETKVEGYRFSVKNRKKD